MAAFREKETIPVHYITIFGLFIVKKKKNLHSENPKNISILTQNKLSNKQTKNTDPSFSETIISAEIRTFMSIHSIQEDSKKRSYFWTSDSETRIFLIIS